MTSTSKAQPADRPPTLGIVAFLLAVLLVVGPVALAIAVPEATSFAEDRSLLKSPVNRLIVGQGVGMAVPLVLGIVAVVGRRGRSWGAAAIAVSILLNLLLITELLLLPIRFSPIS